jgi:hypothetical protein
MLRSLTITILIIIACLHNVLADEQRERIGRAYDKASGVLLYEERHVETFSNGTLIANRVRYTDSKGHVFGDKRVDFRKAPYLPEFQLTDERSGHVEALLHTAVGTIEVRFRGRSDSELRTVRLDTSRDAVADAGFDRFIESHWDELTSGTTLVRRFLVPSRLEFMDWRIQRVDVGKVPADPGTVHFALEIDSAFLRIVVPSVIVVYDRESRRLLRYEGLSNLRDNSGDNHTVRIDFEYVTLSARAEHRRHGDGKQPGSY